jgi:hypothetical protein
MHRLSIVLALSAFTVLAACEEGMMASSGGGNVNTGIGANNIDTVATTPEGIAQTALNAPGNVGECTDLALVIESADSTEVARQTAIDERARLGC